jgi:hypothetical protein
MGAQPGVQVTGEVDKVLPRVVVVPRAVVALVNVAFVRVVVEHGDVEPEQRQYVVRVYVNVMGSVRHRSSWHCEMGWIAVLTGCRHRFPTSLNIPQWGMDNDAVKRAVK